VYLTPGTDFTSSFPFGDDVRFRVSAEGDRIIETRRMHKGLVVEDHAGAAGARLASRSHKTTLRDEPEDSDVYHVLTRRPQAPELIETRHFRYTVDIDGSIRLVQGRETVVGSNR
jgi:hypothetical protein